MAERYGAKIAVGVDARDGMVATHGWEKTSGEEGFAFCRRLLYKVLVPQSKRIAIRDDRAHRACRRRRRECA